MRGQDGAFPTTYAGLETTRLLEVFRAGPERLDEVLVGLDPEQLSARPFAGKWTVREIVLHVTDSELMGAGRVCLALAEPGTPFLGYDQDRWVSALGHTGADASAMAESLALFAALRRQVGRLFPEPADPRWYEAGGVHPEHGPITLRNLLELYADHSERHIGQILARREALGVPMTYPLLLPDRLY